MFQVLKELSECLVGFGGLGVSSSPRDLKFAGSNPAEIDGFFQDVKSPPGGPKSGISGSLKNLKPEKTGILAKLNQRIHILVIPKFGGAQ